MGSFLVAWSNSSFAAQQLQIANQTNSKINLVRESFVVEDVWFYTDGDRYANVTIRNTGNLAITVSNVYINNTQYWSGEHVIPISGVGEIKVPVTWDPDTRQSIWVKTARGSEIKQVWKS